MRPIVATIRHRVNAYSDRLPRSQPNCDIIAAQMHRQTRARHECWPIHARISCLSSFRDPLSHR
jgi:hypothetical protein